MRFVKGFLLTTALALLFCSTAEMPSYARPSGGNKVDVPPTPASTPTSEPSQSSPILAELAQARRLADQVRAQAAALKTRVAAEKDPVAANRAVQASARTIESELAQLRSIAQRLQTQ